MGKIYYIMGKSAVGKDHIYERLLNHRELNLSRIIHYTTRPMRASEQQGREYWFSDVEELEKHRQNGTLIEERVYQTVHGPWSYFTVDDGKIQPEERDYLGIGTLESYCSLRSYFGEDRVVPLYIESEDGERLRRAVKREGKQEHPNYAEICRRYLADEIDFSEEKLRACGIQKRFINEDLDACVEEILQLFRGTQGT